ncbi:heterokaryon incompatibility protein-domain-containing protein [Paraphoma chrysanthemicola]|uniref:Heterokaryon incompatibility protein-domain-containing protein n=1 Tax=Paraphoma chrysanthemicola TaxID=798071 RepID=A0A8K0W3S1_9PLEO|nr:heterokaryon incompatibility protein-domain-containing protein [Paraphoma chrysanthemicola]
MALVSLYDTFQLPEGKKSIRVVRLNRQAPVGLGVELEFRVVELDAASFDYTALSYVWGNPEPTACVLIDNYPMEITSNLNEFLLEMQCQYRFEWFWIDALCINQTDIEEKNHQVQMMGEIYQRASKVMIWLGNWTWNPQLIPQLLDKVAKVLKLSDNNGEGSYPGYTTAELDAIRDICHRPYWQRVWTVQERILAPKLSIACGSMHIEWEHFSSNLERHMVDIFTQDTEDLRALNMTIRNSPAMQIINKKSSWEYQRNNQGVTIENLLFQYRLLQATDPRDRIYGLLALVTPPAKWWLEANPDYKEPTPILADYSKTAVELYESILTLKYPQGAKTKSIDAEIVAEILPATLDLDPGHEKVKEIINKFLPNRRDPAGIGA